MNTLGDSMRGLFFIVKGGYVKGVEPQYTNRVTGDVGYVGGYDPERDTTQEWYMLMDRKTFQCIACGGDYQKVLRGVKTVILKYKGSAKRYFKHISQTTSDDYYEVHYLGHEPLTPDQRTKKAEGRCPRTSPIMRCLYEEIDHYYGDYYTSDIEVLEDEAYSELVEERPVNKSRKIVNRAKKSLGLQTPQETPHTEKRPVLKKPPVEKEDVTPTIIKPVKRSVKLLRR